MMFPIRGFTVLTDNLAVERERSTHETQTDAKKSRKRKRASTALQDVTSDNLADMWEKVIEKKAAPRSAKAKKKKGKQKRRGEEGQISGNDTLDHEGGEEGQAKKESRKNMPDHPEEEELTSAVIRGAEKSDEDEWGGIDDTGEPHATQHDRKRKSEGKEKTRRGERPSKEKPPAEREETISTCVVQPPAPVKLTPLQSSMREKLVSARFRHLNETLYTRPSTEAFKLFAESPDMFSEYHAGFRRQVEAWPENPIDGYIADIKTRAKLGTQRVRHPRPGQTPPLPRTGDRCTIADLGCGDAELAMALKPLQRKLRLDVRSFDLQDAGKPDVITRADIANLPLADGSVDVAIFCLALMGTNWIDFIQEAYRVLRWRGELWVAEIKSRFAGPRETKRAVVEHSVGKRRKLDAGAVKRAKAAVEEAETRESERELAVAVDGVEQQRRDTDVSAFVHVLAKRGFVLRDHPEQAVDMRNKMFVKMYFVKAEAAVKGRSAKDMNGQRQAGKGKPPKKFIATEGEDDDVAAEAAVLKPCVYKLR